nr:MAG TPA: hypothetical protein [Caudoviricetes sp.]
MYATAKHYAIIQTGIGSTFGLKPWVLPIF